ncbi:MAG: RNA pseudouridine synthase [Chromatiales bacterium]|jgi:tRNA pseudouridine32 synthase / 23S rRNA pseudouridine746 synthase|nr:RNA pseudouridine synthase [Chromatiales bacterium]
MNNETRTSSPAEFHLEVKENGTRAAGLISAGSGLSMGQTKRAMTNGAVWLTRGRKTHRLRRATRELRGGDTVHVYYDERVLSATAAPPLLIADEGGYSVWDKSAGLLSQGSKWGDHCTVVRYAEQNLTPQRTGFIVHRLDRAASGLMLIAHHKRYAAALSDLFQRRAIAKRYRVVVEGLLGPIGEQVTVDSPIDKREARSHFLPLGFDADMDRSTLDVRIETGRKHQIRRHLAELGFPVVGDRLHGAGDSSESLELRAYWLGFTCPVKNVEKCFKVSNGDIWDEQPIPG